MQLCFRRPPGWALTSQQAYPPKQLHRSNTSREGIPFPPAHPGQTPLNNSFFNILLASPNSPPPSVSSKNLRRCSQPSTLPASSIDTPPFPFSPNNSAQDRKLPSRFAPSLDNNGTHPFPRLGKKRCLRKKREAPESPPSLPSLSLSLSSLLSFQMEKFGGGSAFFFIVCPPSHPTQLPTH